MHSFLAARQGLAATESQDMSISPDMGSIDANIKRNIFARKITSLLQEGSQSQEIESDLNDPTEDMALQCKEGPTLMVSLPVPTALDLQHNEANATSRSPSTRSRRVSPVLTPSPDHHSSDLRHRT